MDYKEVELHGHKIRFYDENHIEIKLRNKKGNWRKVSIYEIKNYLAFNCGSKTIKIHHLVFYLHNPLWDIYDSSNDNSIDHFDGNTFNNKIYNLSCVTNQENHFNRTKANGYVWNKKSQKWYARISVNSKKINLGTFENEEDAHNAYIKAKLIYHVIQPKSFV